MIVLHSN